LNKRQAITYLLDSSVWIAFVLDGHTHHEQARNFINSAPEANSLLFCRSTQQSFLRLITRASVLRPYGEPPLTNAQAWQVYNDLTSKPKFGFASESADLEVLWRELSNLNTASPKSWMDSYLAAFAITHNATLVTFDNDFTQYPQLKFILLK
jgi:toxin-antitoxin system PIN domain toxin